MTTRKQAQLVDLADRLHSGAIHLLRRLRAQDAAAGLSAPRLSALSVIVYGGPIRMSDLAAAEQVRLPTISRLVSDLERGGYVERVADEADGRVQRVQATHTGRTLLDAGRTRRVRELAGALAALTPKEQRTLADAARLLEQVARPPAAASPGRARARREGPR
jgi:DNA-binding MarR family transcriptional regulator